MSKEETDVTFAIDIEKDDVIWFYPKGRPDLTEEQAQVIASVKVAGALEKVADGLFAIAEAIRESRD